MRKLGLASAARDDLRDIRHYGKTAFGAAVTHGYMVHLRKTLNFLRDRPDAGMLETDLGGNIRSFRCRSQRIYYSYDGGDLLIVRILHHARDRRRALDSR